MSETIMIITLVASIVVPIATTLVGGIVYALRKTRKSSCWGCKFESDTSRTDIDKLKKENNEN